MNDLGVVEKVVLPRFGNPRQTVDLSKYEDASHLRKDRPEKRFSQKVVEAAFRIGTTEDQEVRMFDQYRFLTNVFLRDKPVEEREKIVEKMITHTNSYAPWEKREGDAEGQVGLLGMTIHLEPDTAHPVETLHEGMHFLYYEKLLPNNNALTWAITRLVELQSGEAKFVRELKGKESVGGPFKPEYLSWQEYFKLIKRGAAHTAYVNWQMMKPDLILPKEKGKTDKDLELFYQREGEFNFQFFHFGETIGKILRVESPYGVMAMAGKARGFRAYGLGVTSRQLDHAWTLLYLHGNGEKFEVAEERLAEAIDRGQTSQFYNFETY